MYAGPTLLTGGRRHRHQGSFSTIETRTPRCSSRRLSSAYRKTETFRQQDAAETGGMTYREPARITSRRRPRRTTTRRIRVRKIRVAGLLVVVAAIAAALGQQVLVSSSSSSSSP